MANMVKAGIDNKTIAEALGVEVETIPSKDL